MIEPQAPSVEQVEDAVDRLRLSWGWLVLLAEPGRERRPGRAVDEDQAEALAARGMSDRAYREWNLRHGMSALPPSPAAAQLSVVDAQAVVARLVREAVDAIAAARRSTYVGGRPGAAAVLDALDWLTEGGAPRPFVATRRGVVGRAGVLADLHNNRDRELLARVLRLLGRADAAARAAAGVVDEEVRPIGHRCPACRYRSLQLTPQTGTVRCVRRSCRCAGDGCGCLQVDRRKGRAHVWVRANLDSGLGALATAIAMADAIDAQVDRDRGVDRRVRSGMRGHGGWPDRRSGT